MARKLPHLWSSLAVLALVGTSGLAGGCAQSRVVNPGYTLSPFPFPDASEVVSPAKGDPQIHVEATLLIVPTSVLKETALLQKRASADEAAAAEAGHSINLDPQALAAFLSAIHGSQRVLASPRLDLVSGEPATFKKTSSINYVKSFTQTAPAPGDAAHLATQLHPDTLTTGIWLEMVASISPDQKTLTTRIHPTFTSLDGVDTFIAPNAHGAFVQVPKTTTSTFKASASIPDGGSILFVGPTRIQEAEIVTTWGPFTNHSFVRNDCTFLVLVRPIIAQHPAASAALPSPRPAS
jgi:hypothetical protein